MKNTRRLLSLALILALCLGLVPTVAVADDPAPQAGPQLVFGCPDRDREDENGVYIAAPNWEGDNVYDAVRLRITGQWVGVLAVRDGNGVHPIAADDPNLDWGDGLVVSKGEDMGYRPWLENPGQQPFPITVITTDDDYYAQNPGTADSQAVSFTLDHGNGRTITLPVNIFLPHSGIYTGDTADLSGAAHQIVLDEDTDLDSFAVYYISDDDTLTALDVALATGVAAYDSNNCYFSQPISMGDGVWKITLRQGVELPGFFALFLEAGWDTAIQHFVFQRPTLFFQPMAPKDGVYVPSDEPIDALEFLLDIAPTAPKNIYEGYFFFDEDVILPWETVRDVLPQELAITGLVGDEDALNAGLKEYLSRTTLKPGYDQGAFCAKIAVDTLGADPVTFSMSVYGFDQPAVGWYSDALCTQPVNPGTVLDKNLDTLYAQVDVNDWDGEAQALDAIYKSGVTPWYVTMTEVDDGLYSFRVDLDNAQPMQGMEFPLLMGLRFNIRLKGSPLDSIVQVGSNIGLKLPKKLVWRDWREEDGVWVEDDGAEPQRPMAVQLGDQHFGAFYLYDPNEDTFEIVNPLYVNVAPEDSQQEGYIAITTPSGEIQVTGTNRGSFRVVSAQGKPGAYVVTYADPNYDSEYTLPLNAEMRWAEFYTSPMATLDTHVEGEINAYEFREFYLVLLDNGPDHIRDWEVQDDDGAVDVDYDWQSRTFTFRVREDFLRRFENAHIRVEWTNCDPFDRPEGGRDGREIDLFCQGLVFRMWQNEGQGWFEDLGDRDSLIAPLDLAPGDKVFGAFYLQSSKGGQPQRLYPNDPETSLAFMDGNNTVSDIGGVFLPDGAYRPDVVEDLGGALVELTMPRRELDATVCFLSKGQVEQDPNAQPFVTPIHAGLDVAAFFESEDWDDTAVCSMVIPFTVTQENEGKLYLIFRQQDFGGKEMQYQLAYVDIVCDDPGCITVGTDLDELEDVRIDGQNGLAIPIQVKDSAPARFTIQARWGRQNVWQDGKGQDVVDPNVIDSSCTVTVEKNGLGFLFWDADDEGWYLDENREPESVLNLRVNDQLNGYLCFLDGNNIVPIDLEDEGLDLGDIQAVGTEGDKFHGELDADVVARFSRLAPPEFATGSYTITYEKDNVTYSLPVNVSLALADFYSQPEAAAENVVRHYETGDDAPLYFVIDQSAAQAQNVEIKVMGVEGGFAWLDKVEGAEGAYAVNVQPGAPSDFHLRVFWQVIYDHGYIRMGNSACHIRHRSLLPGEPMWSDDGQGNVSVSTPIEIPDGVQSMIYTTPGNIAWVALRLDDTELENDLLVVDEDSLEVEGSFAVILADSDPYKRLPVAEGSQGYLIGVYCTEFGQKCSGVLRYTSPEDDVYELGLYCGLGDGSFYFEEPDLSTLDPEDEDWPELYEGLVNGVLPVKTGDTLYFTFRPDLEGAAAQLYNGNDPQNPSPDSTTVATMTNDPATGLYTITITNADLVGENFPLTVKYTVPGAEPGEPTRVNYTSISLKAASTLPNALNHTEGEFDTTDNVARCHIECFEPSGVPPTLFCVFYGEDGSFLDFAYQPQPFGIQGGWDAQVELIPGAASGKFILINDAISPYGEALPVGAPALGEP